MTCQNTRGLDPFEGKTLKALLHEHPEFVESCKAGVRKLVVSVQEVSETGAELRTSPQQLPGYDEFEQAYGPYDVTLSESGEPILQPADNFSHRPVAIDAH